MRELYLEKIYEAYDSLCNVREENRQKDKHMKNLDIIGSALQSLTPIINFEERQKNKIDFNETYKETLEKRYKGKQLPYSLKRRYNEIEFICPIDLAFAVLNEINPDNEEEFVINGQRYNSITVLKNLSEKINLWLAEDNTYSVLENKHSFEEIEDLMRGTYWTEILKEL